MNGLAKIASFNLLQPMIKESSKITPEMEEWFEKRTAKHIALVQKCAKKIDDYGKGRFSGLVGSASVHDDSKYKDPERKPYIRLSWQHKSDNYKSYKTPGHIADKEIDAATLHHIRNNEHHPEYWDKQDPAPKVIDATKMPNVYVAEMVADWMAMSEELGSSIKDWADKKVNVRWKFTKEQKKLIYELIDAIEKK